jgi:hypothetical protein
MPQPKSGCTGAILPSGHHELKAWQTGGVHVRACTVIRISRLLPLKSCAGKFPSHRRFRPAGEPRPVPCGERHVSCDPTRCFTSTASPCQQTSHPGLSSAESVPGSFRLCQTIIFTTCREAFGVAWRVSELRPERSRSSSRHGMHQESSARMPSWHRRP